MSRILNVASMAAVALTAAPMLFLAEPGFANDLGADASAPALIPQRVETPMVAEPADLDVASPVSAPAPQPAPVEPDVTPVKAASLAALVATTPAPATLDSELRCLAGAVYFESRGESLAGQLAVARVVINRVESPRYPNNICGVVYQRSQFSFVRGGTMPAIREGSRQWADAVAIAQIARDATWENKAPGALYFHARHVSPGWRKTRVAQIDNHIFYR